MLATQRSKQGSSTLRTSPCIICEIMTQFSINIKLQASFKRKYHTHSQYIQKNKRGWDDKLKERKKESERKEKNVLENQDTLKRYKRVEYKKTEKKGAETLNEHRIDTKLVLPKHIKQEGIINKKKRKQDGKKGAIGRCIPGGHVRRQRRQSAERFFAH